MEKHLNIIHLVLGKGNPNRMNGVNKVAFYLANTQSMQGHHVEVWGITKTPSDPADYEHLYTLKLFMDYGYGTRLSKKLKSALKESAADAIFHLHGGFIPEFISISKILHQLNRKFVITSHGAYNLVAMQTNRKVKRWYFPLLEKKIIRRACKVHLVGESEMEGLRSIHQEAKGVVIPNGQVFLKNQPHIEDTGAPFIFGFLGRLDIYTKGLDMVLSALAMFAPDQRKNFEFWIVGSGKEEKELKKMVKLKGLEDTVIFKGPKYGEDKIETIAHFDAFVHPSRNEGMPGAVLEAAMQGVPCVVSYETNLGSFIEKHQAGIALNKNTAKHIYEAIKLLLEQPTQAKAMGENAKAMVKTTFSWENISRQHIDVYRKCLGQ